MAPLDAFSDLSIRGSGQAIGRARARREVTAPRVERSAAHGRAGGRVVHFFAPVAGFVTVVSATLGPGAVVSDLAVLGSRIDGPSSARRWALCTRRSRIASAKVGLAGDQRRAGAITVLDAGAGFFDSLIRSWDLPVGLGHDRVTKSSSFSSNFVTSPSKNSVAFAGQE